MKYIFVDESRISKGRLQLFGSFWIPRDKQAEFRRQFWQVWDQEFPSRRSELKWTKVSRGKLTAYKKFIEFFLASAQTDFRCVVLDTHALDYKGYHDGDKELGFYKFLYFFLSRNIEKDYKYRAVRDAYQVFIDRRRREGNVEATDSKESPEIQIIDVILGAVGYTWEGFQTSPAKLELIKHIENLFGLRLKDETPYLTERINIWQFKLSPKKKGAPLPTPPKGSGVR